MRRQSFAAFVFGQPNAVMDMAISQAESATLKAKELARRPSWLSNCATNLDLDAPAVRGGPLLLRDADPHCYREGT